MSSPTLLTQQEQQVLQLILQGRSTTDIAQSMDVTVTTLAAQRETMIKKLGRLGRDNPGGAEPAADPRVPTQPYPGGDVLGAEAVPADEAAAQARTP